MGGADGVPGRVAGGRPEGAEVVDHPVRRTGDVVVLVAGAAPVAELEQVGARVDLARPDRVDVPDRELLVVVGARAAPLPVGQQQAVGDVHVAVGRAVGAVDAHAGGVLLSGQQVGVVDRGVGQHVLHQAVEDRLGGGSAPAMVAVTTMP